MKNQTRKTIYFLGALWNLGFALSGLALPGITMWLLFSSTEAITGVPPRTIFAFFWIAVGVFGIGYYLVSRDPDRNEAVIWTGCLAKVLIFLILTSLYLGNQLTFFGFLAGLGDFLWTFLFLAARRGEKTKEIA